MENEIVKVDPKEFGLAENQATELMGGLPQVLKERESMADQYADVITLDIDSPDTAKQAKAVRLLLQKNRTKGINVWHKTNKEVSLRLGQFLDAVKKRENSINERMEATLLDIEKHAEIKEANRILKLDVSRLAEIKPFLHPESIEPINLGNMADDVWSAYLLGTKSTYEARIKAEKEAEDLRIAAEAKAKTERLEAERLEAERIAKIEADNKRLAKEAEEKAKRDAAEKLERDRLARIEADKQAKRNNELSPYIQFIRDYNSLLKMEEVVYAKEFAAIKKGAEDHWEYERQEQIKKAKADEEAERKARSLRVKQEKERKTLEAKLKAEQEAKAKIEAEQRIKEARLKAIADKKLLEEKAKADELAAELKAKRDAELAERKRLSKIESDRLERDRLASLAPEKEKIQKWIDSIEMPTIESVSFSNEGKAVVDVINAKFNAFKEWAEKQKETIK